MTDTCTCQENGEHCCMVHSQEPPITVEPYSSTKSADTPEKLGKSLNVSTAFSDAQLLDVLSNEKITWEYLMKNETDPELKASVQEIIALINKLDARKRIELVDKADKHVDSINHFSSSDNPGEVVK